jgi:hypothetical protein
MYVGRHVQCLVFRKILPVVDIHNAVRTGTISVTVCVFCGVDRTFILSLPRYFCILLHSVTLSIKFVSTVSVSLSFPCVVPQLSHSYNIAEVAF